MKVIAIKPAFYSGARVRVGDELTVPDNTKAAWFVKAETAEAAKAAKAAKAVAKPPVPQALSQVGKGEDKSFIDVHAKTELA